jgi:hypothetical protein
MDRELVQFLAVKFASAVRADPRKHFERLLSIGLLQLSLGAPCHASLGGMAICYWGILQQILAGCSNWFVLFIWFIWSVWFNQTNETNQINQKTVFFCWRTFSASC